MPDPAHEAGRDLVRAREAAKGGAKRTSSSSPSCCATNKYICRSGHGMRTSLDARKAPGLAKRRS